MYDCIVIGGGISGLSNAFEFLSAGKKVALLEPGTPGGVIQTIHKDGFTLERGPNVLLAKPELVSLIERLGLKDKVVEPAITRVKHYIWHKDKPTVLPKSPGSFFSTPLLTARAKISVVKGVFSRSPFALADQDVSVSDYFSDLLHPEIVQNLLDPFLRGIFGGKIEELSARSLFPGLWDGVRSHGSLIGYLKSKRGKSAGKPASISLAGGISTLVQALLDKLDGNAEVFKTAAEDVAAVDGRFMVTTSDGSELLAEQVIVATSGPLSARFLGQLAPELCSELEGLSYAPIIVMHLALPNDCQLPEDGFGVLFPGSARSNMLGVMFNSQLFPATAPSGAHLLTVCLGGAHRPDLLKLENEKLEELVYAELADKFNFAGLQTLSIFRWERAIPQYVLGHQRLVEKMHAVEQRYPGLEFKGADIGGIGVPDRIKISQARLQ